MEPEVLINEPKETLGDRLYKWRTTHLSERQSTIILAFLIGFLASVAAFLLHSLIHEIQTLLRTGITSDSFNWTFLIFPIIGVYLTSLFVQIRSEGQHIARYNAHPVCHLLQAVATETP